MARDLRALPKAHLHIHLEGAMRRSTLIELCERYEMRVPADTRGVAFDGFGGFLEVFWAAANAVRCREDLQRLIFEVVEDAAREGVWWIEIAFDAERYSELRDRHRLFASQDEGWRFALEAAERAERLTGVGVSFVSAIDRIMSIEQAMSRAQVTKRLVQSAEHEIESAKFGRHSAIVGIGLHGNEAGHPPEPFADAFNEALSVSGLLSLPHAGEIAPARGRGAASVRAAVELLRADRVAHGVLAVEDEATMALLAERQVCLDICPTSNRLLKVFATIDDHPLPHFIDAGIPVTIGSDDPLLFGADLVDEFELCRREFGFSDERLAAIARTSFERSAAPPSCKSRGCAAIERWLADEPIPH